TAAAHTNRARIVDPDARSQTERLRLGATSVEKTIAMNRKIYSVDANGLPLKVIASTLPEVPLSLSAVEASLAKAVLAGHSNSKIAADRGVSIRTVSNQLASLYKKAGVSSRQELVVWLYQQQGK
ncbi:MAG: helix-turn-helix transcriptional regulator, partial [Myxococcota bacterium]